MRASEVLRAVRRSAGLTQQALAERAGTTQSAIAAYESGAKQPSVATLDRLVGAAGLRVEWRLAAVPTPLERAVDGVGAALARGDESEMVRYLAELVVDLDRLPPEEVRTIIGAEPDPVGDQRGDALIAGVVEWVAHRAGVPAPSWTRGPERFLDHWWFVTPYRSLHPSALVESPAELANRGVFLHQSSLESV